jgi:peptide/nickel transport system permease protein
VVAVCRALPWCDLTPKHRGQHCAPRGRLSPFGTAIPFLILAIALAAFLGPSLINAMIAIGVSQMPVCVRLTRVQVLSVKLEEYVEAAHAVGNPA